MESILREALTRFFEQAICGSWRGREREAVSRFAFEYLLPHVRDGSPIAAPSQICIECAVPQVTSEGKSQVCKDLVIWPEPGMTCWDERGRPLLSPSAIIEWKVQGFPRPSNRSLARSMEGDAAWLSEFTERYPATLAFAVGIDLSPQPRMVAFQIEAGAVNSDWIRLEARDEG